MKEMQDAVNSAMEKLIASGKIEAVIEKKLESTVSSIVEDELKEYSELGKSIREKVKEALKIDFSKLSIPEYNTLVLNQVKEIINRKVLDDSKKSIEASLDKFFKPLEKTEYTITELVEQFVKDMKDYSNDGEPGETFTFDVKRESQYFTYIYLDREKGKSQYQCAFQIGISDEKIFTARGDGINLQGTKYDFPINGFAQTIFQMYASQVKIIDDKPDVYDLCYWPENEEYND